MVSMQRAGIAIFVLSYAGAACAREARTLTLEEALARARDRAPVILAARARVEEARGRLTSASVRARGNPTLEGHAGRRTTDSDDFTDYEIELTQGLAPAGRRQDRIASAEAEVSAELAAVEDVAREHILRVATAYFTAARAVRRSRHLTSALDAAAEIARAAERRFKAGDVAALDVNVAGTVQARARANLLSADAELEAALGELRILLGLSGEELLEIDPVLERQPAHDLSGLLELAARRPDIRALEARLEQAEVDVRVAKSLRQPMFDIGARYDREEGADIVQGGVTVSIPSFDRGTGEVAEASARALRIRMEADALRRTVDSEVRTAFEVYQQRQEAAAALGQVTPMLSDSEALASGSYAAGQISLSEMLLVRLNVLETRLSHVDLLFEAAIAGIRLEAGAGVLR